jgi:hypothetical protein
MAVEASSEASAKAEASRVTPLNPSVLSRRSLLDDKHVTATGYGNARELSLPGVSVDRLLRLIPQDLFQLPESNRVRTTLRKSRAP